MAADSARRSSGGDGLCLSPGVDVGDRGPLPSGSDTAAPAACLSDLFLGEEARSREGPGGGRRSPARCARASGVGSLAGDDVRSEHLLRSLLESLGHPLFLDVTFPSPEFPAPPRPTESKTREGGILK